MTEEERSDDLCRFCGLTKDSGTSGSITQYIRTCVCSLGKEGGSLEEILDICLRCKKHIGKGRKGSFTQYIFRSELCDCPEPLSLVELEQKTVSKEAVKNIEEAELDLDPAKFPLDRYIPLLELGRGASGRVYLARDRRLQKRVAIKVLTSSDQNQLLAFQEEAKNTSKLNNLYIVRILDFGIAGGSYPYMVLEYLQGISLEEYLKEHGPLAPDAAISVFIQLCRALEYAHEGGIFHRDLKPSNVILNGSSFEDCQVKLIDFGVAKTKHESAGEPTLIQGRTVVGTPAYMSPDQVQGRAYDARSEIYSLGCLMFETLAGSVPFTGETALEILRKHAEEPPPDLSQYLDLNSAEASRLKSCIEKCLAKDSSKRYQSARELRESLEGTQNRIETQEKERRFDKRVLFLSAAAIIVTVMVSITVATSFIKGAGEKSPAEVETKERPDRVSFKVETYRFEPGEENGTSGSFYRVRISEGERKNLSLSSILEEIDRMEAASSSARSKEQEAPQLKLDLSHWQLAPDDLKLLGDRPVTKLILSDSNLNDSMTKALTTLPLTYLNLSGTNISDEGMKEILKLKDLFFLNLADCDVITKKSLEKISVLEKLNFLTVNRALVTDETLEYISHCKALTDIDASNTMISEKGLRSLAKLKSLRHLILEQTPNLDSSALDIIAKELTMLRSLNINMRDIKKEHLEGLSRSLKLDHLRIGGTTVTPELLKAIALNTQLRVLFIRHASIRDKDLELLIPLKHLSVLTLIESPEVSREGLDKLKAKMNRGLQIEAKMGDSTNDFGFFMDVPRDPP